MNRSGNGLSIVTTNLDGFSLANHGRFAKFAKLSRYTVFFYIGSGTQKEKQQSGYARLYNMLQYICLNAKITSIKPTQ